MAAAIGGFELRICPAADAAGLASGWATHAVSLLDPGPDPIPALAPKHLVLRFTDSEKPGFDGPADAHVAEFLAFTAQLKAGDRMVVHCVAGLSRSTALAMAARIQHGASADAALAEIARSRPDMWPNERLARMADAQLGTGGTLMDAIRRSQAREIAALEASGEA